MINEGLSFDSRRGQERFIAYYRVSTKRQGASGLGLEAQRAAVQAFVSARSGCILESYTEVESGRNHLRQQLQAAIRHANATGSRLVIARLDRLAHSVSFTSKLMESSVDFVAVDLPEANKLTIHIMAAMAEHEAEMISKRTKAALARAAERGVKLGNPRLHLVTRNTDAARVGKARKAQERAEEYRQIVTELKALGASTFTELANQLNEKKWYTPSGCRWDATRVRRLLKRLGMSLSTEANPYTC